MKPRNCQVTDDGTSVSTHERIEGGCFRTPGRRDIVTRERLEREGCLADAFEPLTVAPK